MKTSFRLDKYLADMSVGTRSEVKNLIKKGLVTVNGEVIRKPEYKVDIEKDDLVCRGEPVVYQMLVYYMLNKPAGVISATNDPKQQTVLDLITDKSRKDLFPVGRLDKDTEGLLLVTNDGDLAHQLLSPKKHVDKVYRAVIDGQVTEEEEHACRLFADYMAARVACVAIDESRAEQAVEKSVREYGENLQHIDREFRERTRLQDADVAFVVAATMLQVARILIINSLTEVECAGAGNVKEHALHDFQGRVFSGFDDRMPRESNHLFASKHHILNSRGVPYDATRYEAENIGLFKGANHRFATLGHDPVLGLVFGTSNIMTNSITCVKDTNVFGIGARIPATYSVSYDAFGKNPQIGAPAGTVEMLVAAGRRVVSEPDAAAAALIKQLIHIGTDLYTPCGIQIPFANLILDKTHTEALTKYVSTGDVLKVGAQAGMAALINWLIAALHGCTLIFKDDGSDYCTEMYQARTKKIILLSDTIATSSSVIRALIKENPECLDLGGAAILIYRLFSDVRFIAKLKEEYVQSELNKIYDERARGLL